VRHFAGLWLENREEPPEPYLKGRQTAIMEAAWACVLASCGIMVKDIGDEHLLTSGTSGDGPAVDEAEARSESQGPATSETSQSVFSDPIPMPTSEPSHSDFGTSNDSVSSRRTGKLAALEKAQMNYQAVKRLSLLASSIGPKETASKIGQHMILSKWPEERGVSTEGYVSTVAEAQYKKFEEVRRRGGRIEARKERRAERNRSLRSVTRDAESSAPGDTQSQDGLSQAQSIGGRSQSTQVAASKRALSAQAPSEDGASQVRTVASSSQMTGPILGGGEEASQRRGWPSITVGSSQGASQTWSQSIIGSQPTVMEKPKKKKGRQKKQSGFR
jgi:hypothetical protein